MSQSSALATRQPPPSKQSLIEFSSESREDPNDGVVFGDVPVHCACPHCDRSVMTFIDHEASWVTWVLGFVVWFSLGWMAFWVLPLLWPAFKDVVHHCPRCLNVVARKSRISVPTFKMEVMTFKIGGCAVVLARKYVMILLGLVGVIGTVYALRQTMPLTHSEMQKGQSSMLTWEDFLFDCGPRTSLRQRASQSKFFEERYRRRTFTWQGEVRTIREGFDVMFLHTKSVVMVKMYPPRWPKREQLPDVALLFGEERNREVADLAPSDWVEFEATMAGHGHRGDPEVMMLWHIKKVPEPHPKSSSAGAISHHDDEIGEGHNGTVATNSGSEHAAGHSEPPAAEQVGEHGHTPADSRQGEEQVAAGVSAQADAAPAAANPDASAPVIHE